jgi:hypothetical protein
MSPQFKNMTELTSYLEAMENRVNTLEVENDSLKQSIRASVGEATKALPRTALLSRNFFQRAFTVWGHYFVAELIISLVLLAISLVIIMVVPGMIAYLANLARGTFLP